MKFTNSKSQNTQHFIAVTCVIALFFFGLFLLAISNEPCSQGLSAEETLRRRLPNVPAQGVAVAFHQYDAHNNWPQEVEVLRAPFPVGHYGAHQAHAAAPAVAQANPIYNDIPVISGNDEPKDEETCLSEYFKGKWANRGAILTGIVFGGFVFSGWSSIITSFKNDGTAPGYAGLGVGIGTSLAFVYFWIWFLSYRGSNINSIFGSGAGATAGILVSSACILCSGVSLSSLCVENLQAFTNVAGALSIGALFAMALIWWFKPVKGEKWGVWRYGGVSAISGLSTIGAAFLIFGAHNPENAMLLTMAPFIFGGVLLAFTIGALVQISKRYDFQSCVTRKNNN